MRVHVGVDEVSDQVKETELRSLHQWLRADRAAWRHSAPELESRAAPQPGAQGQMLDVLSLAVSAAFNAASLAAAIATWRATRPVTPALTLTRPDGTVITVNSASAEEARRLLEGFLGEQA